MEENGSCNCEQEQEATTASDSMNDTDNELPVALIAGATGAGVIVLTLAVVVGVCVMKKRRSRLPDNSAAMQSMCEASDQFSVMGTRASSSSFAPTAQYMPAPVACTQMQ